MRRWAAYDADVPVDPQVSTAYVDAVVAAPRAHGLAAVPKILLKDVTTGLEVVLPPILPPEGYRQLVELSLTEFTRGPACYDRYGRRWRADRDEARSR